MSDRKFWLWMLTALASFMVAAVLGALLRYAFVGELPSWLPYKNLQHTHSHVAMMGWLYSGFFILVMRYFQLNGVIYTRLFWATQFSVLGMFCTFPWQGYGLYSIFFTTLHLLLSYLFIVRVFLDLKRQPVTPSLAILLLKSALVFLFISTLGTWALGAIMNSTWRGTAWYYAAIQFFLHYQFNGWFIFGMLAFFFRFIELRFIKLNRSYFHKFYWLLVISCILTFALAITWSTPDKMIFWLNSTGVIIQVGALIFLWLLILGLRDHLRKSVQPHTYALWTLAFLMLSIKIVIQALVAIPDLAIVSYTIRNFVVGFIHLLMLGSLSIFILGTIHEWRLLPQKLERTGTYLFLVAFFTTELLLFIQGLMLWIESGFMPYYHELIFLSSLLFPMGIIIYSLALVRSVVRPTGVF